MESNVTNSFSNSAALDSLFGIHVDSTSAILKADAAGWDSILNVVYLWDSCSGCRKQNQLGTMTWLESIELESSYSYFSLTYWFSVELERAIVLG